MTDLDYNRFLKALKREPVCDDRPVYFEHYIEWGVIFETIGDDKWDQDEPSYGWARNAMTAAGKLGCDVWQANLPALTGYKYDLGDKAKGDSISQNEGAMIEDEEDFENYNWPDPNKADPTFYLDKLAEAAPEGLKCVANSGRGILECLVDLVGFDDLCMMMFDEPELVQKIVDAIGSRSYRFVEKFINHDFVLGYYTSDDWGYKTSLMFSPDFMKKYIFPWHKKIVELAHKAGKVAVLHSCGNVDMIMDDIIDDIKYDGLTSFEDVIEPVESVYERYGDRIAILGGIDQHFMHVATPDEIRERCKKLFEMSKDKGGYTLGTGNSITDSMPKENVKALRDWEEK